MPRLLLITRNFPPLVGGMEKLNFYLAVELSCAFDVHVIAPEGARQCASVFPVDEVRLRPLWRFFLGATLRAICRAFRTKPQFVLAGSGLMAPLVWLVGCLCGARTFVYVHGLDLSVPSFAYRCIWLPFISRMDGVIANSESTAQLARSLGVKSDRLFVVNPGVVLPPNVDARTDVPFRVLHGLGGGPILLSVGRLAARKGLREFVRDVLPSIVAKRPDVQLIVIGDEPVDSLYATGQSIASIRQMAASVGVGGHLYFLGKCSDQVLMGAYSAAAVHVFPIRAISGDPEGFGMVAIEAAAHGVPTVAYATGGVIDAVSDGISGRLVPAGDAAEFAEAVIQLVEKPLNFERIREFAAQFSWDLFGKKIIAAICRNHTD